MAEGTKRKSSIVFLTFLASLVVLQCGGNSELHLPVCGAESSFDSRNYSIQPDAPEAEGKIRGGITLGGEDFPPAENNLRSPESTQDENVFRSHPPPANRDTGSRASKFDDVYTTTDELVVGHTTFTDKKEAERLAKDLVLRELAACVNVIPSVKSFYMWEGKLQADDEYIVKIKTRRGLEAEVTLYITEHSSYDIPEIIFTSIHGGGKAYINFMEESTNPRQQVAVPTFPPRHLNTSSSFCPPQRKRSHKLLIGDRETYEVNMHTNDTLKVMMTGIPGTGYEWYVLNISKHPPGRVPTSPRPSFDNATVIQKHGVFASDPVPYELYKRHPHTHTLNHLLNSTYFTTLLNTLQQDKENNNNNDNTEYDNNIRGQTQQEESHPEEAEKDEEQDTQTTDEGMPTLVGGPVEFISHISAQREGTFYVTYGSLRSWVPGVIPKRKTILIHAVQRNNCTRKSSRKNTDYNYNKDNNNNNINENVINEDEKENGETYFIGGTEL